MAHLCHARGCGTPVRPELLMCAPHWRAVPRAIQRAVWAAYRPGQCDDKRPSAAWHLAADAAIGHVARREGRPLRAAEAEALREFGYAVSLPDMALRKRSEATGGTRVPPSETTMPAGRDTAPAAFSGADPDGIREASRPLAEELAKKPEPPPLFASANRGPGIAPDFERIVETVYAVDAFGDYEDLEKNLEVGEDRGDYRTLTVHLDKAEARARKAHRLYLGAKLELARFEAEHEPIMAAMREKARAELEVEKDAGERRKAITDADVRARMIEKFPDEVSHAEIRVRKMKGTAEHLERLADLWKQRCFTLSTLLSNLRK